MSKKILAMFMATAMAATTFFGCGSTEEASKKDEGSSTTSTDEDASTKTDDEKVTLLMNHINSEKRDSLNGHSPFELSQLLLDNKLHNF